MKARKIILLLIISLVGLSVILVLPLIFAFGKSGRETTILGRDYATLNKKQIIERMQNDFDFNNSIKLVNSSGRRFDIQPSSISAQIDVDKVASSLLYRRLNLGIKSYVLAFLRKKDFDLEVQWDKNKLGEQISRIADQVDKPFIPAEIIDENGQIKVKDGELGYELDKDKMALEIVNIMKRYLVEEDNEMPIRALGSLPNESQKNEAIDKATSLIGKKVTITWENGKDEATSDTLISFVGFGNNCNRDKVEQYVANLNNSIKQEPRDASFKFENNKVTKFESSKDGFVVDQNKMSNDICQNIDNWAINQEKEMKYEAPLIKTAAKVKTDEVNDLGIKELIGRGTSSFRHSSEIRNINVEKGAEIVNRILVAPNETFSFIKNLGEVSLDNGFKQAYVINKGKTVLDVGGGICQVSTTLFRAMLDAGLNITDRKGHAYRVSYYEEDSKPGFDATVFIPNPDLKFVNDTGNYVLIQSFYDGAKKTLAYEIYGTKDGRKVEISNYKQWDASPAPPDVWIDDPTLPPGKVVKDESRVPGLKTSFDWKVTKDGEVLHQKTYVTNYVPWAAVYRRGI